MSIDDMNAYDREAWDELAARRERLLSRRVRRFVPERVRRRVAEVGRAAADSAESIPGADQAQAILEGIAQGAFEGIGRAALLSLRPTRIVKAFRARGYDVGAITDIRTLDLRVLDGVRPRLVSKYLATAGASGVGAGFVVSGGEIAAVVGAVAGGAAGAPAGGVGAVPGAGAGAAPGVTTVVAAVAADAATTMGAAMRLVFETAGYYGFDVSRPEERLRAMAVLNVATARDMTAKARAYAELHRLVGLIVRNATWKVLDENAVAQIVQRIFRLLAERLTKQKLADFIPLVGIAAGGGFNVLTISRVADAADLLYREQFLREKYRLDAGVPESEPGEEIVDAEVVEHDIPIVELVQEGLDVSQIGVVFALQFDPAHISALAARYSYDDDSGCVDAGTAAARRGWYSRDEFLEVCRWKTPRSSRLLESVTSAEVEQSTRLALRRDAPESARIEALVALRGVGVPTASAVLHFAAPDRYPILDVRALESLGFAGRSTYSTAFWVRYVDACRSLAADHGVSLRVLDKALWQYSKERAR